MRTRTDERCEGRAGALGDSDRLQESFDRSATGFAAAAQRVRAGSDPEAIHDLRVAARRLAAALRVWRDLVPARVRRDAVRRLRRLRRRIGRARELEVEVALLEERLPARGTAGRSVAEGVLERLRERLARRRRSAARRVSPRRLRRVLRRLQTAGSALGAPRPGGAGASPGAIAAERRLADRASIALRAAMEHPDDASLHEARVMVKKWRYTLECLAEAAPGAAWQAARPLRRIQRELGDAHDRALLRESIERHARRTGPFDDASVLRPLIGRLELERERAVRRFLRLAAALVDRPPVGAADGAQGAARTAEHPRGPADAAAEPPADGATRVDEDAEAGTTRGGEAGAADDGTDPRDERWDRMATWLARSKGRG